MKQIGTNAKKIEGVIMNRAWQEACAMVLFGIGIFLFPIYLRAPLLKGCLGSFRYINFLGVFATVILIRFRQKLTQIEKLTVAAWIFATVLTVWSNEKSATFIMVTVFFQNLFPLTLLLCRFEKKNLRKICKYTLYAYDVFIVVQLLLAVFERFSGYVLIQACYEMFGGHDLDVMQYMALTENRFGSIWGHALTNALFFNTFYILNDCYYKSINKKYPKIVFFLIALSGVLLTASKTALVVLGIYFLMTSFKDKRIMFVCAAAIVVLFAVGGFDTIIDRFTSMPLTTGRMNSIKDYLESGIYPFGVMHGYGTSTAFSSDMEFYKAAFEFPLLMFALDYGIIFSLTFLGSIYFYVSYQLLKRKQYTMWIGFTGLFAEINTYNGISIRSHDICIIFCLTCMLLINMSRMPESDGMQQIVASKESGQEYEGDGNIERDDKMYILAKSAMFTYNEISAI